MAAVETTGERNGSRKECEGELHVILYAKDQDALGTIRNAVAEVIPDAMIKAFETVEALGDGLRKPTYNCTVAVIVASGKEELREISSLQQFLWGLRTIVVLPDEDDETISLAHGLRPRFVSSYDDSFLRVIAVLNKMLEDHNSRSIAG